MISDLADYKYAIPSAPINYLLPIIPQRDVLDNGSWKYLYGVDVAFLLEAVAEREQVFPNEILDATTGMTSNQVLYGYILIEGSAVTIPGTIGIIWVYIFYHYDKWLKSLPNVADVVTALPSITSLKLVDADVKASQLLQLAIQIRDSHRLKADYVRHCFWALQQMRRFYKAYSSSNVLASEMTYNCVTTGGAQAHSFGATSKTLYELYRERSEGWAGTPDHFTRDRSREVTLTGGTVRTNPALVEIDLDNSYLLVRTTTAYTETNKSSINKTIYVKVPKTNITQSNGFLTISTSGLNYIAQKALQDAAIPTNVPNFPGSMSWSWGRTVRVDISEIHLYATLGDHTDISGIGWTWEPL